jgi:nucleoside-diphosphate-sugar epimerase
MTDRPVAVTGGTGYVASWIIRELLARGVDVRATVRDRTATGKHQHLLDLAGQLPGTLELFEADLLSPGSFDACFAGCGVVMHTASPFVTRVKDAQRDLVDPAVQGTRNVLDSVGRAETVSRVVLTSSVVAIYGNATDRADRRYSEADWNTTSTLRDGPYHLSKTLAEKEAWRLADAQDRWRLVVINPGFVLGPALSARPDGTSVSTITKLLDGTARTGMPDMYNPVVDVREVATAHAEAALRDDAEGRHIIAAEVASFVQIAEELRVAFPSRPLPRRKLPTPLVYLLGPVAVGYTWGYIRRNLGHPFTVDNSRGRDQLGLHYRPMAETLRDQGRQLIDMGLV